ncbi:MAG TPA: 50S ribosomal protein L5, partial [Candidatus Dormibacteraeota bacterium]|nr:50S ribosomal protein L5 [Candidatus Dormibacteraeota bacterium]
MAATKTKQAPASQGKGAAPASDADATATVVAPPRPRLQERYLSEIAPALREEFGYANVMQVPGLSKIVVNMGVGEAARDAKL